MTTTFTQHLLAISDRPGDHTYAHVLSPIAISLKLMAAIISRGALNTPAAGSDGCGEASEMNATIRAASIAAVLDQTAHCDELAAISFFGDELHRLSDNGRYLVAIDIFHNPSVILENQPIGVCFSVIERSTPVGPVSADEYLCPSTSHVCAGLALFGPSSVLMLTTGDGVDGFTLDREVGNFVLTHPSMRLLPGSNVLAIDLPNASSWQPFIRRYVDERIRDSQERGGRPAIFRWNNSAVLGAFRVLLNGGLFMLPRGVSEGVPLVHTAFPLTMLIEQAGGAATDGTCPIADLVPTSLARMTSLILGTAGDIARIEQYSREYELEGEDRHYPLFHNRTLFIHGQ